jgi:hypothetical protein
LAEDRDNLSLLRSLFVPGSIAQSDTAIAASPAEPRQSTGGL